MAERSNSHAMDWIDSSGDGGRLGGHGRRPILLPGMRRMTRRDWGPLSGEACCSPPGFSVSAWAGPCCCLQIRVPAATTPGTATARITRGLRRFGPRSVCRRTVAPACLASAENAGGGCAVCSGSPSPTAQPMTSPVVEAPAPGVQPGPSLPHRPAAQPRRQCRLRRSPVPPRPPRGRCLRLHRFPTRRAKCPIRPPRPPQFRHHNRRSRRRTRFAD